MLIKDPHPTADNPADRDRLEHQRYNDGKPIRMVREDYSPIKPEDVSVGGQMTVFPGIPGGTTNEFADSPALLIHLRDQDAAELRRTVALPKNAMTNTSDPNSGSCGTASSRTRRSARTPAARPASTSSRPTACSARATSHSSSSPTTPSRSSARPPGVADASHLVDDEGYLVAEVDFGVAVGPAFWERPNTMKRRKVDIKALPGVVANATDERYKVATPLRGCSTRSSRTTGRSCWARSRCSRSSSCC